MPEIPAGKIDKLFIKRYNNKSSAPNGAHKCRDGGAVERARLEIVFTPIRVTRVQIPFSAPNEYNPNPKPILVGEAFGLFLFL